MSAPSLLVVGEALMDVFDDEEHSSASPGGSPLNVAVAAARLGVTTAALLSGIGADDLGLRLQAHLDAAGVSLLGGPTDADARTSTARAVVQPDGSARYEFDVATELPPVDHVAAPSAFHLGSIGAFVEPGAAQALALLRAFPDALASFDPNIRPQLVGDPEAARQRVDEIAARADVVKLSDEDAEWLYPGATAAAVGRRLLDRGVGLVVITRGGRGCSVQWADQLLEFESPKVAVVDTIGAGDTFMAALIVRILELDVVDRLRSHAVTSALATDLARLALRCAAVTVTRRGCNPPTRDEVS